MHKPLIAGALSIGLLLIVVSAIMSSPTMRDGIVARQAAGKIEPPDLSSDPKSGTKVLLPKLDSAGRRIATEGEQCLLVFAGPCSTCTKKILEPLEFKGPFRHIVMVFDTPAHSIPRDLFHGTKIFTLSDENFELAEKMNAVWYPRFYLLDSSFKLVDLQRAPQTVPSFLTLAAKK